MPEDPEPRQADGTEESVPAELGEPTDLEDVGEEGGGSVPDLDAREERISSERRAAGPPLVPAGPDEGAEDAEGPGAPIEANPTDPE